MLLYSQTMELLKFCKFFYDLLGVNAHLHDVDVPLEGFKFTVLLFQLFPLISVLINEPRLSSLAYVPL